MSKTSSIGPSALLAACDSDGLGLRVEFLQVDNQFAHRVVAFDREGHTARLIESIEGAAGLPWPKSPVLQGLNTEDLNGHNPRSDCASSAAMLIGTAGDGHWSLSIEPRQDDRDVGLLFDAACRVKSLPTRLTSSYRLADAIKIEDRGCSIHLGTHLGDFCLRPLPLATPDGPFSCQLAVKDNSVVVSRETQWTEAPPTTVRWRYQVSRLG